LYAGKNQSQAKDKKSSFHVVMFLFN